LAETCDYVIVGAVSMHLRKKRAICNDTAVPTLGRIDIAPRDHCQSRSNLNGCCVRGRGRLKRRSFFQKLPPRLVGIEACASSHHWSRELQALGHTVRLMSPAYVKPYVKRHKNDATRSRPPSRDVRGPALSGSK
jgi:hypothetical protein